MHPFTHSVKYHAAKLITHPIHIIEPAFGRSARQESAREDRRAQIINFLKVRSRYTAAIASEIGVKPTTVLEFLQKMVLDGLLTMERGSQQRCLWSVA
jgi:DNA-binding MarR family transcriptional regulator